MEGGTDELGGPAGTKEDGGGPVSCSLSERNVRGMGRPWVGGGTRADWGGTVFILCAKECGWKCRGKGGGGQALVQYQWMRT